MSTDEPEDWDAGCNCIACQSPYHDATAACDNPGRWYIETHLVDNCDKAENGTTKAVVCVSCFTALVESAQRTVNWGWAGIRSASCLTCNTPLIRLSNVIKDVAKV